MIGRNKLKNWANKYIPINFNELYDVLLSYTGKKGRVLFINKTEDGIEDINPPGNTFDTTRLDGYNELLAVTGNDNNNIASALSPIKSSSNVRLLNVSQDRYWMHDGSTVGMISWTGIGNGSRSGAIYIYTAGTWSSNKSTGFAQVATGFYWFCLSGSAGQSFKFWYDVDKWYDAFQNTSDYIYFDKAGCVWSIPASTGNWADRKFVCGPTVENGFGVNLINLYYDDAENISNSFCPVLDNDGTPTCSLKVGSSSYYHQTTVGEGILWSGAGDYGIQNDKTKVYFSRNGTGVWTTFADVETGFYSIQLVYEDASANVVQGSNIRFWYDKEKWIIAFRGHTDNIYIDTIGNVWKGDPINGGEFVCGVYESANIENQKSKVSINDSIPGYLLDKLDETNNIKLIEKNDGKNESIEIKSPRLPEWDSTYTYSQYEFIVYGGKIYKSLQNSNTNKNPSSEAAWWSEFKEAILSDLGIARVHAWLNTTHQTILTAAHTKINFNAEGWDYYNEWNMGTLRFEPSENGTYRIVIVLHWTTVLNAAVDTTIWKNGSMYNIRYQYANTAGANFLQTDMTLTTSDYLEFMVRQYNVASKDLWAATGTNQLCWLDILRVR